MCILGFWLFLLWHHQNDEYYFHIFSDPRPLIARSSSSVRISANHMVLNIHTIYYISYFPRCISTIINTFYCLNVSLFKCKSMFNMTSSASDRRPSSSSFHGGGKEKDLLIATPKSHWMSLSIYIKNLHSDLFCSETWFLFFSIVPHHMYDGSWSRTLLKRCF